MIDYLRAESSIFDANKGYCENIYSALKDSGFNIKGSCSSYGYTILAQGNIANLDVTFRLEKSQSTQGGNLLFNPGAIDSAAGQLLINGLSTKCAIHLGRSGLIRFFCNPTARMFVPKPVYLFWSKNCPENVLPDLALWIKKNSVYAFKLNKGKVQVKFEDSPPDLSVFLAETLHLVKNIGTNS